ncbi:MAG TPA: gluconate 2-dehydrogenase subunit 3 family protein [Bryobacteraceae bacterium]|jgi:gluconate 2-dehydrogenase gamma chain|nr:gluconate 2-dehydrogenase subunit 3 family protein [Bryobacteraceae bacterium]
MPEEKDPGNVTRRSIIVGAAIVPITAIRSAAQTPSTALTADQFKLLDAFTDRLIPKDENGPGASECGAAHYIDRQLADYLAGEKANFVQGLAAVDAFAQQSQGKPFVDLTPEAKDAVLTAMDSGSATGFTLNSRTFFNRVRRLTLEGTFSDPYYGGNKGFAGWDLIGYPGPRLAVSPEEQKMRVAIKPAHLSAWGGITSGH